MGETLRTKSQSKAEVTFEDGTILRLAEKTAMEVKEYMVDQDGLSGVLSLTRGKIQSLIKAAASKIFRMGRQSRFEVHTPPAVVGVRGTDFFTYYLKGISGAIFQEGTGYGYNVNKPDDVKTIRAGQSMVVVGPDKAPVIKPATEVEIKQHMNDTSPSEESKKKAEGEIPGISDTAPFPAEAGIGELADDLPAFIPSQT
ncbi:MAG: FecR domain-containing protein, partial [Syntrophobacteraceae bacterium]|nr:FecR domain-containing protein [Syntrophobacteraceae bacterium]